MRSSSSTAPLRHGERAREETKTSKCISICKVPDLSCRWEKKTRIPYDFTSRDSFCSFVCEFLLRKTYPFYSSFLFEVDFSLRIYHITFTNSACECNFETCFCMNIPRELNVCHICEHFLWTDWVFKYLDNTSHFTACTCMIKFGGISHLILHSRATTSFHILPIHWSLIILSLALYNVNHWRHFKTKKEL